MDDRITQNMIDMKLWKAILKLVKVYEEAKKSEFVHNPVAWALYQTWKEFDK